MHLEEKRDPVAKINSRNKGATFERLLAKDFSEWWGCEFKRTPLSGGWGKSQTAGDLVPIRPDKDDPDYETKLRACELWPFSVEGKHHKDFSIDGLFHSPQKSPLAKFLTQCRKAAKKERKLPLLVAKKNFGLPVAYLALPVQVVIPGKVVGLVTLCEAPVPCHVHVITLKDLTQIKPDELLAELKGAKLC